MTVPRLKSILPWHESALVRLGRASYGEIALVDAGKRALSGFNTEIMDTFLIESKS